MTKRVTRIKIYYISLPPMGSNLIRERRDGDYYVCYLG